MDNYLLGKKETELELEKKACEKLAKSITQKFTGSMNDLLNQLRTMKHQLEEKESDRQDVSVPKLLNRFMSISYTNIPVLAVQS